MLSKLLFQREFHDFRMKTFDSNDEVVFAVIGGDFNVDNISPGKFIEIPLISVRLETLLNFFYCKKKQEMLQPATTFFLTTSSITPC